MVRIVAHRGHSGPFPENTRRAIEEAIALGVPMVEVDVRLSRDGVPVLIHHETLEQTTNGRGRVADQTWGRLHQLDAGRWKGEAFTGELLLNLYQALELARGRVALNLDLKTPRAIPETIRALRGLEMIDQVVLSGCTWPAVHAIRRREPRLTYLLNLNASLESLARRGATGLFRTSYLALARLSGAAGINPDHRYVDRQLVTAAHRAGLSVWTWTVDDEARFRQLLTIRVDSITTNRPERMMAIDQSPCPDSGSRSDPAWP